MTSTPPTAVPAVSVVMPVYNAAGTLTRAAGSVLAQSFSDLELILVDDGSADESAARAEALDDPRVKTIRFAANQGAAAARNAGVAAARAPLIAFHDADDVWVFDKLERQLARLAAAPEAVAVYTGALFYDLVPEPRYAARRRVLRRPEGAPVLSGDLHAQVIAGNLFNLPTLLLRRAA
ncbi:MAG: glycosyltransferase family A protein, partial [Pseudomonadota bacterium]